jgi:oxygen-dependent protoporphyrinogen oxidase
MKVAVVGGGIAGLAAVRRLETLLPEAEVLLVERTERLGGKLVTEDVDRFVVEGSADSFLSRKERGIGLAEELGLQDELIARRPEHHGSFIRLGDALHPLPEGLTGMIPTSLDALQATSLLSPEGKRRFAREPEISAVRGDADESVASFVSRRFGREAYDALVEPLMTGIYGGDGEQLSLLATFPGLRDLELEHGSVLRGLSAPAPDGRPPFVSLRSGMATLVTALVAGFERTEVLLGLPVARVGEGHGGYTIDLAEGDAISCDGVVVATSSFIAAELVPALDPELAADLAAIPYASSAVVTLAFARADVIPLDGYGYVVPRIEGTDVLACTWTSQKWAGRAPDDAMLIRVYAGRFGGRDVTQDSDEQLVSLARDELRQVGVSAEPTLTRIHRWPSGMPQYVLGHPERLERIEAAVAEYPGLALAGAAYRGVGIPDCIRSGEQAAESVAHALAGARA